MDLEIVIIGCGFVADLYMRSLRLFPQIRVRGAFDIDAARRDAFCAHWSVPSCESAEAAYEMAAGRTALVLNLTNPHAHYDVTKAALAAGCHVYSEKPLAMRVEDAQELVELAAKSGLMLSGAPCSVLGETAQVLAHALRSEVMGKCRLIYAELDDGFIPKSPYRDWISASGAPWPYADEFEVGCTLEHAGYYLTWLIAAFGPVESVHAVSAETYPDKEGGPYGTPDLSVAMLKFRDGPLVRLTCSIIGQHDHSLRAFCDEGVIKVDKAWDNFAPVRAYPRLKIRRRVMDSPLGRRLRSNGCPHPKFKREGAARMNFALGPLECLEAIRDGRAACLSPEFVLHVTEVALGISAAGLDSGPQKMITTCDRLELSSWV